MLFFFFFVDSFFISVCFLFLFLADYLNIARQVKELFHEFDIHCTTIQPEFEEVSFIIPWNSVSTLSALDFEQQLCTSLFAGEN